MPDEHIPLLGVIDTSSKYPYFLLPKRRRM